MKQDKYKWMVYVRCFTFNQAPYIEDAMNGFTMQQTDFPYMCCIMDDASNDGEQEVIKKYVEENFDLCDSKTSYIRQQEYGTLIFCRHKSNYNCYFVIVLLKDNHYSNPNLRFKKREYLLEWSNSCKYEAVCEGDDYWTDPLKLQKQVDFLEAHPDYGLCYTKVELYNQTKNVITGEFGKQCNNIRELILYGNTIPTLSVLINNKIILDYFNEIQPNNKQWLIGDYPIWLFCINRCKIKFLNYSSGIYRVLNESASHSKSSKKWLALQLSIQNIKLFFINKYNLNLHKKVEVLTANAILRERILVFPDLKSDLIDYLANCKYLNYRLIKIYKFSNKYYIPKMIIKFIYYFKSKLTFIKRILKDN